eukprot:TRINITY_DN2587_c0_g1_i2.p1 TRINITY_DN2587_c0_g1~~TRINITY_DN2587_c0_g1_i2.p1  ORF type:complete len:1102 (+),score=256.90 TRINITY_DN2587_c0_g1_i2:1098-4403(+)
MFTDLSPTGRFTTAGPLLVVLLITATKEAYEDYKRHKSDKEVNFRTAQVFKDGEFEETKWKDVRVGDVVKVKSREYIPADLVLLSSPEPNGICYVETSNLDGETNLKIHQALSESNFLQTPEMLSDIQCDLHTELPNTSLYTFTGNLYLEGNVYPLGPKQLLLRGAMLRNCHWVYGVVIFTGDDTKLMQNSKDTPSKRSNVEIKTNRQIIYIFLMQMVFCVGSAIARGTWVRLFESDTWYLGDAPDPEKNGTLSFFTFLILYNNLIPISLYVSMELVKFAQAFIIGQDQKMYYAAKDMPAQARTSNLNEELGQVEYIFSDKTGTLTRNMMEFRRCSVAGKSYGSDQDVSDEVRSARNLDPSYNFDDSDIIADLKKGPGDEQGRAVADFIQVLAVCHSVIPEVGDDGGDIMYQASSPDENALVVAAKELGYYFYDRTTTSVTVAIDGHDAEYEILNVLEFNSTRKRMSVIVKTPEGKIMLYCKGADTVIYERLAANQEHGPVTLEHLHNFAAEGLRTLVLAQCELDEAKWREWNQIHADANKSLVDREKRLDEAAELIEKNLELVGATAIEDKLQEGVPEAIAKLAEADIKLWVLTGDKMETAINIGYACHLLTDDMYLMQAGQDDFEVLRADPLDAEKCDQVIGQALHDFEAQMKSRSEPSFGFVIDGATLKHALHPSNVPQFLKLTAMCQSVICCRVSPLQKAEVVDLARIHLNAITLAIGDGANDVSMIQAAHVGIGISGEEGLQAARAADYSIAQFRYLVRLLLIHGRWSYRRISTLICYSFYKNIALYLTQFWFIFFNGYSGQSLYEGWVVGMFNIIFAFFPILVHAICEQDVSAAYVIKYPKLYRAGQLRQYFNFRVFWGWVLTAIYHSCVTFMITVFTLAHENYHPNGQTSGLYATGTVLYSNVVIVINVVLGLETRYWTIWNHVSTWGSILALWLFYLPYCVLWTGPIPIAPEMYWIIYRLMESALFWFSLILVPVATILLDVVYKYVKRTYYPDLSHVVQDIERTDRQSLKHVSESQEDQWQQLPKAMSTSQSHMHHHTGFAFSESLGRADFVRDDKMVRSVVHRHLGEGADNTAATMAREHSVKVLRDVPDK